MKYLIDTNVLSEWVKPKPDENVRAWVATANLDDVFLSVVTLAEIKFGLLRMPQGQRRIALETWFSEHIPAQFEGRIFPVDATVAEVWADISAARRSMGRTVGIMDGFLAATAVVHNLALVTRNTRDFEGSVPNLVNPWLSGL